MKSSSLLELILPNLVVADSALSFRLGCLRTLSNVLKGSKANDLLPNISLVLEKLSQKDIVLNENMMILLELSKCILYIQENSNSQMGKDFSLFWLWLLLDCVVVDENVPGYLEMKANLKKASNLFIEQSGIGSCVNLYVFHIDSIISRLNESSASWNRYSVEPKVLASCVASSRENIDAYLETLFPTFETVTNPDFDPYVRER